MNNKFTNFIYQMRVMVFLKLIICVVTGKACKLLRFGMQMVFLEYVISGFQIIHYLFRRFLFYLVYLYLAAFSFNIYGFHKKARQFSQAGIYTEGFHIHKAWIRDTFRQKNHRQARVLQLVSPVISGDLVIQGNKTDGVYAYTAQAGKKKWVFPVKGGLAGGVLVAGGRVFFSGADGFFYSLLVETGQILWKQYTGVASSSTPVIKNARLYFASTHKIYCLKVQTGNTIWIYPVPIKPGDFMVEGVATPLVTPSLIYFKTGDGTILALNQRGKLKWKRLLSRSGDRFTSALTSPVMGKVCLYSAGFESGVYCLNKRTGKVVWKHFLGSQGDILLFGARLFYPASNGQIMALDQKSGKEIWTHPVAAGTATSLVLFKDLLIYGEYSGALRFLSVKTGREKGRFFFGWGLSAAPQVSLMHSALYFISNFGWLYKVDIKS